MKFNTKRIISIVLVVILGVGAVFLYRSQNPTLLNWKKAAKYTFLQHLFSQEKEEIEGLSDIENVVLYEDNLVVSKEKLNPLKDNKKLYLSKDTTRLVNYTDGYMADFCRKIEFDFSMSPIFTKGSYDGFDVTISKEFSPYEDVEGYIAHYLNRFILNRAYQTANKISVTDETITTKNGYNAQIIRAVINEPGEALFDGYAYALIKTESRMFYRLMFKYNTDIKNIDESINKTVDNFKIFGAFGKSVYDVEFSLKEPDFWSTETKQVYEKIQNSDKIRWGIFAENIYENGINETVPEIEKKIDYEFPVILSYLQFGADFPTDFMNKNYQDGKIVELTYQITGDNNQDLFAYTPNLDVYRGLKDEQIRQFARSAKEFGHPFLFRLNNEMNSDWTSYSGIINMSDPDIYVENWKRFYNIFKEEGVNNAIWIYNPNDQDYPPCNWNDFLAYYPGDEYVQMVGITGYNTGTYYKDVTGEMWREFKSIYDDIQSRYEPFFGEFPWIITEFSSSSVGGDKVRWIDNMFSSLDRYPNIKIAVWFSYADYDTRPEYAGQVARAYWLDETNETLNAFKLGIKKHGRTGW